MSLQQGSTATVDSDMLPGISERYKYMPINVANHEIRVLMLLPGVFDAELRIELISISFPPTQSQAPMTEERKARILKKLDALPLFANQISGRRSNDNDPEQTFEIDPTILEVFFHNIICDGCGTYIAGCRYKCLSCSDFDYCSRCIVNASVTHPHHEFATIYKPSLSMDNLLRLGQNLSQGNETLEPEFEALSYTWGSMEDPSAVLVGRTGSSTVQITRNLAVALPYLRNENEPRMLWIDAICVDQQNLEERSQQVQRMADIYSRAKRVIVWLGPPENQSQHALNVLKTLSSKVVVNWQNTSLKSAPGFDSHWGDLDQEWPKEYLKSLKESGIEGLLNRDWFKRLWILQEIALASPEALILCGNDSMPWTDFAGALAALIQKRYWPFGPNVPQYFSTVLTTSMSMADGDDFEYLVNLSRNSLCSDNRDRIFAIRSLAHKDHRQAIVPDYTKEVHETFRDFVVRFVESDKRKVLDVLRDCVLPTPFPDSPTWVPDWTKPSRTIAFPPSMAAGFSWSDARYSQENALSVTGVICATITNIFSLQWQDLGLDIPDWLHYLAPGNTLHGIYVNGKSVLEAFCRVLYANRFHDRVDADYAPTIEPLMETVSLILNKDPAAGGRRLRGSNYWEGRVLFTTREGYIGLATDCVVPGDQVCVLMGCQVPLIVRPIGSPGQYQYQVAGESYVQGLMDGEALLGTLPSNFRAYFRNVPSSGAVKYGFLNLETQVFQYDDPRLGLLPDGWTVHDLPDYADTMETQYFMCENSVAPVFKDPRLTRSALRGRGVMLQTLDLV